MALPPLLLTLKPVPTVPAPAARHAMTPSNDDDDWPRFRDKVRRLAERVAASNLSDDELAMATTHLLADWAEAHPQLAQAGADVDGLYREIIMITVKAARAMESGVIVKWRDDFQRLQGMLSRWGPNKGMRRPRK